MEKYDHLKIEKKWQIKWDENKVFKSEVDYYKPKFYCLVMLPYPSGNLHMGHVRNYVIGDVFARFNRMIGNNVLHPIGWDAFGLPAENAAIKNGISPKEWTEQNIANMKKQLKMLGISYDWSREISTCKPEYYKWNQWFFLKMNEIGLVFRKKSNVNWCPLCKTVLANEQVLSGKCWRCDSNTEIKKLEQWFLRITNYANTLLEDMKQLKNGWEKQVLSMQTNWIGKSVGVNINFDLFIKNKKTKKKLKVFTTRPETIFGVTFVVISPEHDFIRKFKNFIINYNEIAEYKIRFNNYINKNFLKEKYGIPIKGIEVINPANNKKIPMFVSSYVLKEYGTGAIMAVPAHDKRDSEFAKVYNIPIIKVIAQYDNETINSKVMYECKDGVLINSKQFNGMDSKEASIKITNWLKNEGNAEKKVNFKIKDWLISRQRKWGTPIPIIYCKKCGIVPVPERELPLNFPKTYDEIYVICPNCNSLAKRETDTMDTFVDSSWYYMRYCDPNNSIVAFDIKKAKYWMPVDQYIGGIEHACMHLIYARFWYKVMKDLGIVAATGKEPFTNLLTQGMVTLNGSAMSKSRGNIISPNKISGKYGVDALRLFILFAAPPKKQLDWSKQSMNIVKGCHNFLNRLWRLFEIINMKSRFSASKQNKNEILLKMNFTIKKVTENLKKEFKFNTAISHIMELVNALYVYKWHSNDNGVSLQVYKNIILLMYPFTPHICEELWERLGNNNNISEQNLWPQYTIELLDYKKDIIEIPVQINGKLRGKVLVNLEDSEDDIKRKIKCNNKLLSYFNNKKILKFMYIKSKIVVIVSN
ncbi:MAG: leucine--tRNA ligase [Endomicrobium sp.]|jgi:leucyl-tRNA synthetase|nr:leucine--tRNA ligase [Endomicrobium sp.]